MKRGISITPCGSSEVLGLARTSNGDDVLRHRLSKFLDHLAGLCPSAPDEPRRRTPAPVHGAGQHGFVHAIVCRKPIRCRIPAPGIAAWTTSRNSLNGTVGSRSGTGGC